MYSRCVCESLIQPCCDTIIIFSYSVCVISVHILELKMSKSYIFVKLCLCKKKTRIQLMENIWLSINFYKVFTSEVTLKQCLLIMWSFHTWWITSNLWNHRHQVSYLALRYLNRRFTENISMPFVDFDNKPRLYHSRCCCLFLCLCLLFLLLGKTSLDN